MLDVTKIWFSINVNENNKHVLLCIVILYVHEGKTYFLRIYTGSALLFFLLKNAAVHQKVS